MSKCLVMQIKFLRGVHLLPHFIVGTWLGRCNTGTYKLVEVRWYVILRQWFALSTTITYLLLIWFNPAMPQTTGQPLLLYVHFLEWLFVFCYHLWFSVSLHERIEDYPQYMNQWLTSTAPQLLYWKNGLNSSFGMGKK